MELILCVLVLFLIVFWLVFGEGYGRGGNVVNFGGLGLSEVLDIFEFFIYL